MAASGTKSEDMQVGGSYIGAAVISASVAVILFAMGHVDPTMPHGALQVPGMLIAFSPDIAIQTRRAGAFLATAGPEVTVPLRLFATTIVFLVMNVAPLVLFETTDEAWRGVRFWEAPKPFWAALIFTAVASALYMMALEWQIAPFPRVGLTPAAFAMSTLGGGLFYGLGKPRREPVED